MLVWGCSWKALPPESVMLQVAQKRPRIAYNASKVSEVAYPPPATRPYFKLRAAPVKGILEVICLSESVHGFEPHFDPETKSCLPCCGDPETCLGCQEKRPTRWKGFVAAYDNAAKEKVLLEITAGAIRNWPAFKTMNGQLRGKVLRLFRLRPVQNGPVRIELGKMTFSPAGLPREFDVREGVFRVWGYDLVTLEEGRNNGDQK